MNDIIDKYEYLYSEYVKAFRLHKMKYKTSLIELLIPAGAALLTGQPISAFRLASDFIKLKLVSINLLEEEAKLSGKEIAYIYRTNEDFK
jgi:hypothetical protein